MFWLGGLTVVDAVLIACWNLGVTLVLVYWLFLGFGHVGSLS